MPAGQSLLLPGYVSEMLKFKNLTNDWNEGWADLGIQYGLGTYRMGEFGRIVVPGTLLVLSWLPTMHIPGTYSRVRIHPHPHTHACTYIHTQQLTRKPSTLLSLPTNCLLHTRCTRMHRTRRTPRIPNL